MSKSSRPQIRLFKCLTLEQSISIIDITTDDVHSSNELFKAIMAIPGWGSDIQKQGIQMLSELELTTQAVEAIPNTSGIPDVLPSLPSTVPEGGVDDTYSEPDENSTHEEDHNSPQEEQADIVSMELD